MRFDTTLARLMQDELKGATVTAVERKDYVGGDCCVTLTLVDGREARLIVVDYRSEYPTSQQRLKEPDGGVVA